MPRVGYWLLRGGTETPAGRSQPQVPVVAVLPFQNMSGNTELDYAADGLAEDLITALSKFRSFATVARNSSFTYKGRAVDVRQAAHELGAHYVLEGSVRALGGKVRVTAQLIAGASGIHLWASHFDGAAADLFEMQDRVTQSVAGMIGGKIQQAEFERTEREAAGSTASHDLYLRALARVETGNEHLNAEALGILDAAIEAEPLNAALLALAGHAHEHRITMAWPPYGPNDRQRALELANRSLEIGSDDAVTLIRAGMTLIQLNKGEYERGLAVSERAAALNPSDPFVVWHAAIAYMMGGRLDEAARYAERAIAINQGGADISMTILGHVALVRGDFEDGLRWANRAMSANPNFGPANWMTVAAYHYMGRMEEAREAARAYLERTPGVTIAALRRGGAQALSFDMYAQALRAAGMPEGEE